MGILFKRELNGHYLVKVGSIKYGFINKQN